ncbi:MAG TPA: FHA domain-containing protein [Gemmatimonadales bacterium]
MLYVIIITAVLALAGIGLFWFFRRERQRGPIHASPPPVVFIPHRQPDAPEIIRPRPPTPQPQPAQVFSDYARPVDARSAFPAADPVGSAPHTAELAVGRTMIVGTAGADGAAAHPEHLPREGAQPRPRRQVGALRLADEDEPSPSPASATGTLRMLPGRFEVVEGHPSDREIRFVAEPGIFDQCFTMGRGDGTPGRHVRLHGQTVSRMHAALSFRGGMWTIENLSTTNPLRLNGHELVGEQPVAPLADGDIVELGEVVLRFRS